MMFKWYYNADAETVRADDYKSYCDFIEAETLKEAIDELEDKFDCDKAEWAGESVFVRQEGCSKYNQIEFEVECRIVGDNVEEYDLAEEDVEQDHKD